MFRSAMVGMLLIGFCGPTRATDPAKLPKELAIVPDDALLVASFQVKPILQHAALKGFRGWLANSNPQKEIQELIGIRFEEIERFTLILMPEYKPNPNSRRFEPEAVTVFTMHKPIDRAAVIKGIGLYGIDEAKELMKNFKPGDKRPSPSGKTDAAHYVGQNGRVVEFVGDRTLVLWVAEQHELAVETLPGPVAFLGKKAGPGPLAEGIAMAVHHPVAFAANVPGIKAASERDPPPEELGPLFKADRLVGRATLGRDSAEFSLTATFAGQQWSADAEEALKGLKQVAVLALGEDAKRIRKREGSDSPIAKVQDLLASFVRDAAVARVGNDITVRAKLDLGSETAKLLEALPGSMSESAGRTMSANNLKQIGLALHNYEASNGKMPTNIYSKDGKPLLSWRVQILPYMDAAAGIEFKLDEPWDSEANKKMIEKMPKVFALPGVKNREPGMTHYRSFMSAKGATLRAIMHEGDGRGLGFATITDGLSNTIFCIEVDEPCVWTKPDDIPFDPKGKIAIRGGHFVKDRFQAAFCDGSVRMMNAKMPEATLKAYITTNGGEVIRDD